MHQMLSNQIFKFPLRTWTLNIEPMRNLQLLIPQSSYALRWNKSSIKGKRRNIVIYPSFTSYKVEDQWDSSICPIQILITSYVDKEVYREIVTVGVRSSTNRRSELVAVFQFDYVSLSSIFGTFVAIVAVIWRNSV